MVTKRGYAGGPDHFRHRVADLGLRPGGPRRPSSSCGRCPASRPRSTGRTSAPGRVEGGERRLYAFVMVLDATRGRCTCASSTTPDWRASSPATSRPSRFWRLCQVPAVRQPQERGARAQGRGDPLPPALLELADALPLRAAAGAPSPRQREGPRRASDPLRARHLLRGPRRGTILDDLNEQAAAWCEEIARGAAVARRRGRDVREAFEEETRSCSSCPATTFPSDERVEVRSARRRTSASTRTTTRVPHTHVQRDPDRARERRPRARPSIPRRPRGAARRAPRSFDRDAADRGSRSTCAALVRAEEGARTRPWHRSALRASCPRRARRWIAASPSVAATSGNDRRGCCACSTRVGPKAARARRRARSLEHGQTAHPQPSDHVLDRRRREAGRPPPSRCRS